VERANRNPACAADLGTLSKTTAMLTGVRSAGAEAMQKSSFSFTDERDIVLRVNRIVNKPPHLPFIALEDIDHFFPGDAQIVKPTANKVPIAEPDLGLARHAI
jgi:hypothetical protein